MTSAELPDVALFGVMERYGDLCIHAVLDLRRTFSRDALERAVAATIADFPVLGCRYEVGFWRDRWTPVEGPSAEAVHVEDVDEATLEQRTDAWARRTLSPKTERPFRVVALQHGGRTRLVLSLLHLAVDGAGVAAVGHVFGSHLYGVAPALPVERGREIWRVLGGLRWFHLPVLLRDVVSTALQPLFTFGVPPRSRPYPSASGVDASWRHVVVSNAELDRLKARCRAGASVNDVLVAALARVAAGRSAHGPVVVTYTMDLRRYARSPRLMASNSSSILTAMVPRHAASGSLEETVRSVAGITARHREGLVGPAFLLGPYALGAGAPHAVARAFARALSPMLVDWPLARGLLVTNVGRVDDGLAAFGEDIEALRIVGPNLDGVSVPAVVAYGFRGALHLELFAPRCVSPLALDELEREVRQALA